MLTSLIVEVHLQPACGGCSTHQRFWGSCGSYSHHLRLPIGFRWFQNNSSEQSSSEETLREYSTDSRNLNKGLAAWILL